MPNYGSQSTETYRTLSAWLEVFVKENLESSINSFIFEYFTIGVSVRLSDRSVRREKQKNSSKIAPCGVWNQDLRIFRPMPYQLS